MATVIGCALVGLGLFLGLRAQAPPTPSADPPRSTPPPARSIALSPEEVPEALRVTVTAQVSAALDALRPRILAECWEPALAKKAEPRAAEYILRLTFDAAGKEILRGVTDVRGSSRGDVGQCLRQMQMNLSIPPPGAYVPIDIRLTLP